MSLYRFQTRESPLEAFARQYSSKLCDYNTRTPAKFLTCVKLSSMADGLRSFEIAKGCSHRDRAYQPTVKVELKVKASNHKMISYKIIRREDTKSITFFGRILPFFVQSKSIGSDRIARSDSQYRAFHPSLDYQSLSRECESSIRSFWQLGRSSRT